jgi:DNA-binding transcriptional LysR family regulator
MVLSRSDALDMAVEKGELDAAVVPAYPGLALHSNQLELGEDRVRVAARADHPLSKIANLSLDHLADYFWVMPSRQSASRRLITQIFERAGAPTPRVTMEADYVSEAVMGLVSGTDLLAAVPASVLRGWFGRVNPLPLPMLEVQRSLVLLTRSNTAWSPLTTALRDLLLTYRLPPSPQS